MSLPDFLPIRRILVDGEPQRFVRDLDFASSALAVEVDASAGVARVGLGFPLPTDASPTATLALPLVVAGGKTEVDGSGVGLEAATELVLSVASTGHVNGGELTIFVAAYSRSGIVYAPSLNAHAEDGSAPVFDVGRDTVIVIRRRNGRFDTLVRTLARIDATPPIVIAAHVTTADQTLLRLDLDEWCTLASLAGITLTFVSGTPRTVLELASGDGSSTLFLRLSGAVADSDVIDVVVAAGAIKNLDGLPMAAITVRAGWYMVPTEWPDLTLWRDELLVPLDLTSGQWPTSGADAILMQQVTANQRPTAELFDGVTQLNMGSLLPNAIVASNGGGDLLFTSGSHGLGDNQPLVVFKDPGATLPGGITQGYIVWTKNTTSTTFKVSATNGGANIAYSSSGSGTIKARKVASIIQNSGTLADLVSTSEDTFWTVSTPLDIMPHNGAPSNNPGIWGHGYRGVSLYDNGTDDWRVQSWGYQGGFKVATTNVQMRTPCLIRSTRNGSNIIVQRDRGAQVVGDAITGLDAFTSSIEISRSQPNGYALPQVFALLIAGNDTPTAKEQAGIEGYLSVHPACRFLRPNLALPPTLWITVGRTGRLQWDDVLLNAMPSQFTFEITGPGTATSTGWSWAPSAGDVGSQTLTVKVKLGGGVVAQATMTLVVTAAAGTGQRLILHVGDSITGSPGCYPPLVYDRLVADGLTPTMIGTRGGRVFTAAAATDLLTDVSYGTGYAEATKVRVRRDTSGGTSTLPGGLAENTDYYWRDVSGATGKLYTAPTGGSPVNLTTDGVGTLWITSERERCEGRSGWQWIEFQSIGQGTDASPFVVGGALDVAAYLAGLGLESAVTHITFMLGTNDLVLSPIYYEDEEGILDSYIDTALLLPAERIVQAFRAAQPTAKIGIIYTPPPNGRQSAWTATSTPSRWSYKKAQHRLCRRYEERFGGRTVEGIYLIPSQCIDPDADFDPTNNVHPNTQGQGRLADSVAAWIKAVA